MGHKPNLTSTAATAVLALFLTATQLPTYAGGGIPSLIRVRITDGDGRGVAAANGVTGLDGLLGKDFAAGISGARSLNIHLDEKLPECTVYAPSGRMSFEIPYGGDRRVYPPGTFASDRNTFAAYQTPDKHLGTYRNVALNPYDVRGKTDFYPHATSNSECRNEPDFCARNAIDGFKANTGHGGWPYQSWGPDQRTDLWWKLEFGRPVTVDKIVLYIRADFPHDRHWHKATIRFSSGHRETITIAKTGEAQEFKFRPQTVTWLKITDLVQDKPLGWCGFTEVEVWGRDAVIPKNKTM